MTMMRMTRKGMPTKRGHSNKFDANELGRHNVISLASLAVVIRMMEHQLNTNEQQQQKKKNYD